METRTQRGTDVPAGFDFYFLFFKQKTLLSEKFKMVHKENLLFHYIYKHLLLMNTLGIKLCTIGPIGTIFTFCMPTRVDLEN